MAAYFMTLVWAAIFGNTAGTSELMIEEWIICIQLYLGVALMIQFKKSSKE
jgi:hypothetical protein